MARRGPQPRDDAALVDRAAFLVLLRGVSRWAACKGAVAEANIPPEQQDAATSRVYRKLVAELQRIQCEGRTRAQLDIEAYEARLEAFAAIFPSIAADGTSVDVAAALSVFEWLATSGRWRELLGSDRFDPDALLT
jgi:hypothetical protein